MAMEESERAGFQVTFYERHSNSNSRVGFVIAGGGFFSYRFSAFLILFIIFYFDFLSSFLQ